MEDQPRSLVPLGEGCICVAQHAPAAYIPIRHHILPRSWGGPDTPANMVTICSNTHDAVHRLIDDHIRYGGVVPWEARRRFSPYQRALADRAWAQRPAKPTFTLLHDVHGVN